MIVWKFPVPVKDEFSLEMPEGTTILSLAVQSENASFSSALGLPLHGTPMIWVLCSPENPKETRRFFYVGTGHEHGPSFWDRRTFIGTVQIHGGLVFHLFERDA